MITFLAAVYNEEKEIDDLIESVAPFCDALVFCDDGSTDSTPELLHDWGHRLGPDKFTWISEPHTGLPETVKNSALKEVEDSSWVLMLDADERLDNSALKEVREWCYSTESDKFDYVYFRQIEYLDGMPVLEFQKCKLFRKEAVIFPLENIHADDQFVGAGTYRDDWVVKHRKSSTKQIIRETEYLQTYKKLLIDGSIDQGRYEWLVNLHHYVKPHG